MTKPSMTKEEQIAYLSEKWSFSHDSVREMLQDIRNMNLAALIRGERLYVDNFGTFSVQIKPPTIKRLPGKPTATVIGARVNVKFEESEMLRDELTTAFADQIQKANG